jgi:hypothetical protein
MHLDRGGGNTIGNKWGIRAGGDRGVPWRHNKTSFTRSPADARRAASMKHSRLSNG